MYATDKEKAIAKLLRTLICKVQDIDQNESLFFNDPKYSSELFYARQSGRYQGLLNRITDELLNGKKIEDINLDK
jgi:hypothetical protein